MNYAYRLKESAKRSLERLNRDVQTRIATKIKALETNPRPHGSAKLSGSSGLYRIRIGDYRVVYEVNDDYHTVEVTIIAHRREVYRDL